jgi:FecR protein
MLSLRWVLYSALTSLLGLPASSQSVISAHSGLLHVTDGAVFLDDQRVEHKTGKFDQMKNGSELRTEEGRAEVLLTPGTFLRLGAKSAVRMISNDLDNTRVELLNGSAVLDQGSDTLANSSVTILYNHDQVQIKKPGRYRFDSDPPQVKVETGSVEVIADGKSVEAGAGYAVPLEGKITARKLLSTSSDDLDTWSAERDHSVTNGNLQASAASDLSGVIDGWQRDPDAVLEALGIPTYPQGMSSYIPPYTYGPTPYGPGMYAGLYGSGLYGFSGVSPVSLYYAPLYLPYRYPSAYNYRGSMLGYRSPMLGYSGLGYRNPTVLPGRIGIGGRSMYQGPATIRVGPGQPAIGRAPIGVGVGHPGAVHAGGHR